MTSHPSERRRGLTGLAGLAISLSGLSGCVHPSPALYLLPQGEVVECESATFTECGANLYRCGYDEGNLLCVPGVCTLGPKMSVTDQAGL